MSSSLVDITVGGRNQRISKEWFLSVSTTVQSVITDDLWTGERLGLGRSRGGRFEGITAKETGVKLDSGLCGTEEPEEV